jgi:hypothetical protein
MALVQLAVVAALVVAALVVAALVVAALVVAALVVAALVAAVAAPAIPMATAALDKDQMVALEVALVGQVVRVKAVVTPSRRARGAFGPLLL